MRRPRPSEIWRRWLRPALPGVLAVVLFRSAVADVYVIPSGSMKPSLLEGDRVVVNKAAYALRVPCTTVRLLTWDAPDRGEIVTFVNPVDGRLFVKRVIGVPGDEVELRADRLRINGRPLAYEPLEGGLQLERLDVHPHPILTGGRYPGMDFGPVTVPPGHVFVMGDHRDTSLDSRTWGFLEIRRITGRAFGVGWSFRPDRFLRELP